MVASAAQSKLIPTAPKGVSTAVYCRSQSSASRTHPPTTRDEVHNVAGVTQVVRSDPDSGVETKSRMPQSAIRTIQLALFKGGGSESGTRVRRLGTGLRQTPHRLSPFSSRLWRPVRAGDPNTRPGGPVGRRQAAAAPDGGIRSGAKPTESAHRLGSLAHPRGTPEMGWSGCPVAS